MSFFNAATAAIKDSLKSKPQGLTMEEFKAIVVKHRGVVSEADKEIFKRYDYFLSLEDKEAKTICANIELVKFGVIAARPSQNKKSDLCKSPTLPQASNLTNLLTHCRISSHDVEYLPSTAMSNSNKIDKWVTTSLTSGVDEPMFDIEVPQEEERQGNAKPQTMMHISAQDLCKCIAHSRNATVLNEYAMDLMSLFEIYGQEVRKAQSNMIADLKTENLTLSQKVDMLLAQGATMLGTLSDVNTQLTVSSTELAGVRSESNKQVAARDVRIEEISDRVEAVSNHLAKKCEVSTIKPSDSKLHSHICIMRKRISPSSVRCRIIGGESGYHVGRTIREYESMGYKFGLRPHYVSNWLDARHQIFKRFSEL